MRTPRSPAPGGRRAGIAPRLGLAVVRGVSMEPTLLDGDRLLVHYGAPPHTGDLVLVRLPKGPHGPRPLSVKRLTRIEQDGSWWVESDNLGTGTDSWTVGALAPDQLLGRVLIRLPRRHRPAGRGR